MKNMLPSNNKFILTPIISILKDAFSALDNIGAGIEVFPLQDYFLQSVFLKMTGFQEQKLKCIYWELGSNNYEYRYEVLANKNKISECSSADDKNKIYKGLIDQIEKHDSNFQFKKWNKDNYTSQLATISYNDVIALVNNSSIKCFCARGLMEIEKCRKDGRFDVFSNASESKIILDGENFLYTAKLYRHRNRCAHNLRSYQQNLPSLKDLAKDEYALDNYVEYFCMLNAIDNVFVELYKEYLKVVRDFY